MLKSWASETVEFEGCLLPAARLRRAAGYFAADADYLLTADWESERLERGCGLTPDSAVLDIGCGPGRLPLGILRRIGDIGSYVGIDDCRDAVDWAEAHIRAAHPTFQFLHSSVQNAWSNPGGREWDPAVALPVGAETFDIAYLYDVFSHMEADGVRRYLEAIRDVLLPEGHVFFTAFVEDGVEPFTVNPANYKRRWKKPLECVRYDREYLSALAESCGFELAALHHGTEIDGQSAVYLSR